MKKTINVNLAGQIFYVEEDAYPVLDKYLQDVRAHFAQFADSEEIQKDIEARIAEQLLSGKLSSPARIVTHEQVQAVIADMGNPAEFGEAEEGLPKRTPEPNTSSKKRLFRNGDDAIVGGVASGIAAYFDVETIWVRVVFVVIILAGGWGLILYLALWLMVPEAKSATDKVEMRGEPFDLKSLERSIKEKVTNARTSERAQNLHQNLRHGASSAGSLIKSIVRIVMRIAGGVIALACSLAIIGLIIAVVTAISGSFSSYVQIPLREVFGQTVIVIGLIAVFFAVAIPLTFGVLAGVSLGLQRSRITSLVAIPLVVLWIAAISTATAIGVYHLPQVTTYIETSPEYRSTTEQRTVPAFSQISADSGITVMYVQSPDFRAEVETTEAAQGYVSLEESNGILHIREARPKTTQFCVFCVHRQPKVTLYAPQLESVMVKDGSSFTAKGLDLPTFILTVQNGSRAYVTGNVRMIRATAENGSRIVASGTSTTAELSAISGSRIEAESLATPTVQASAREGSRILLSVTQKLNASADAGSRIQYNGTPTEVSGNATQIPAPPRDEFPPIK